MLVVSVEDVIFERGNKVIFDKIFFNACKSKITAIMGPSGCGKTTLLKLIVGQLKPKNGVVKINNKDINKVDSKTLSYIRKDIGMLFQAGALFPDLNVYENVAFPLREHTDLPEYIINDLVDMKLYSVGLSGSNLLMPSQLSIGMAKRAALARTIVLDPSIIIYDEPFSGQDPISMTTLIKLIVMLNRSLKITTIIVSHDVYEIMNIADYIYMINEKKIIAYGTPNDIRNSNDSFVKYFINRKISYNKIVEDLNNKYEENIFNIK